MSRQQSRQRYTEALAEYNPTHILGVDEVGVGAWAGPVYVGGTVTSANFALVGLRDSKKVSENAREPLCRAIYATPGLLHEVAYCSAAFVDQIGIQQAVALLTKNVIELLSVRIEVPSYLIVVDGDIVPTGCRRSRDSHVLALPKADDIVPAVMAAANIAKLQRDERMRLFEKEDPELYGPFGFAENKGYGTEHHRIALGQHPPTALHRRSYRPVALACKKWRVS